MPDATEALRRELAEAKAEIEKLRLRLSNVTLLLRKELMGASTLPKPPQTPRPRDHDVLN